MGRNLKTSEPEEILRKGLSQMRTADEDIPVPEDLSRMIGRTVDREFGRRRGRMRLVASISSVAAAAAIAAVALIVPVNGYEPQDTFDDPALACAEAVRALEMVGANLGKGLSQASAQMNRVEEMTSRTMASIQNVMNNEQDDK